MKGENAMKKSIFLLLMAVFFVSCEVGFQLGSDVNPVAVHTDYKNPEKVTGDSTVENAVLMPIDETKEYIFDPGTKRVYDSEELPDGEGALYPLPFYMNDGTIADVLSFNYDKTTRYWYIKVRQYQEVVTDGIVVAVEPVERIFKQRNNEVTEDFTGVFPVYRPETIESYSHEIADLMYQELTDGEHYFWFPHNQDWNRTSGIYGDFDNVDWFKVVGNTIWTVGTKKGIGKPQIFTINKEFGSAWRRMDDAWAVYKR
jgi:hypothetical protein